MNLFYCRFKMFESGLSLKVLCKVSVTTCNLGVSRVGELGDVGAGNEAHSELGAVLFVGVIDRKTLTQFTGGGADDVVFVGVILRPASEDINADGALLDLFGLAVQRL